MSGEGTHPPAGRGVAHTGISGSPGLAIGTAFVLGSQLAQIPRRLVSEADRPGEMVRFAAATSLAREELRALVAGLKERSSANAVLEAYALMVEDPMLAEMVEEHIVREGRCAEWAVALSIHKLASQLFEADDPYLRERSRDIEFVGEHLLRAFGRRTSETRKVPTGPIVLVARDLSPADTAGFVSRAVIAFVTEGGTRTSHTAITARALKLPAVVGVSDVCDGVVTGDTLIVDGLRGVVVVRPSPEEIAEAEARVERYRALTRGLLNEREHKAATKDGVPLLVRANVEIPEEAREAQQEGADGIGLYRTEYLFIDRLHPPTEEEQFAAFRAVLDAMPGRPVVLRTFDIGGDKFASTFKMPVELNPMLGLRAVRLAMSRPEVFLQHLRAMVRAAAHGDVRIMVPMVSSLSELSWVRDMLDKAKAQLREAGEVVAENIPLGVMVEVPSAALLADHFARRAAFMSIGTNDLIQYTLAVDRASRRLAYLASPFDPAIARLIHDVVAAGERHGCPVSVCGAMAGDPLTACLLLGLGVRELSMEVGAIGEIRETMRRISLEEARAIGEKALIAETASEVEELVATAFAPRLQDLLTGDGGEELGRA